MVPRRETNLYQSLGGWIVKEPRFFLNTDEQRTDFYDRTLAEERIESALAYTDDMTAAKTQEQDMTKKPSKRTAKFHIGIGAAWFLLGAVLIGVDCAVNHGTLTGPSASGVVCVLIGLLMSGFGLKDLANVLESEDQSQGG